MNKWQIIVPFIIAPLVLWYCAYKNPQLDPKKDFANPEDLDKGPVKGLINQKVPLAFQSIPLEDFEAKTPFKPVYKVSNNKDKWAGDGFDAVLRNECNKCEKVCWHTAGDPGGMTCLGFATRDNSCLLYTSPSPRD